VQSKVPVTIVTGFLGAGKTSLIRHIVERARGRRLAFIINEFGELGVDRELLLGCGLAECGEDDVVELANGCICCTVADDFLPTMRRLLDRSDPPEHIVIETSGLALPKPLIKAFGWPEVRTRATVDGVLALVDAEAVAAGRFAADPEALAAQRAADPSLDHESPLAELLEEQLGCADLVILNKADAIERVQRAGVEAALAAQLRPGGRMLWASHGAIDPAVALGLGLGAEDDLASRPSPHELEGEEHDHDDFESFTIAVPPLSSPADFAARLADACRRFAVLRAKGFLVVEGKPMRLAVQAVGDRVAQWFDRPWRPDEPRQGRLVVIGLRGVMEGEITEALATP
jgi:cobalamin biosynthesis protein CobW